MTDRDPNLFGDSPSERFDDGTDGLNQPLDLPLELYFAEDRRDPDVVAANASLEAGVLQRVGSERGFVSRRERTLIRTCRGVALMGALCVLLAAAVADRLGAAPWNPATGEGTAGPVSGLVASTSQETAGTIERARDIRDRLLRVVEAPEQGGGPSVVAVTLRPTPADEPAAPANERAKLVLSPTGGPYLTAEGFGVTQISTMSTVIRFEDGFSVPAMASDSSAELRWPASRDVTASVVSFESGGGTWRKPATLSPVWYADRSSHQQVSRRIVDRPR